MNRKKAIVKIGCAFVSGIMYEAGRWAFYELHKATRRLAEENEKEEEPKAFTIGFAASSTTTAVKD